MKYSVIILEPAKDFLSNLDIKFRAKAFRTIELLQEFGPFLKEPHAKKITGTKNLFELRIKFSNNICRLFYFHHEQSIYVITSGYVKKDQKLDKAEINKALKLMKMFMKV
jgi:phage-related protein